MTTIWDGSNTIASTANADNTYKAQLFTATAAQTVFVLTVFSYQVGTGSLIVEINGVAQFIGDGFTETSNTTVTLVSPANLGDKIVIRGFIGGTAAQSAEASAAQAAAYANTAAGFTATSTTSITVGLGSQVFTIEPDKLFDAGDWVIIASLADATNYMSGPVISYVGTALTVNVTERGGGGTFADWNIKISGVAGVDGAITNIVQTAVSYTLTSTPTLVEITPTSYGQSVTLPNAAALTPKSELYAVNNIGGYPVKIVDSTGNIVGFVAANTLCNIGLTVASAAGTWAISNNTLVAGTAYLGNSNFGTNGVSACVDVGSSRELLISGNGYGVIYNRATNTFGTVTLIRAITTSLLRATLIVADTVLVVSCANTSSAMEAVVLSLSGNNFTVNTATAATLAATIVATNAASSPAPIVTVGTSYIIGYSLTGGFYELRAITISGTTPTIGAAVRTSSVDVAGATKPVYIGYSGSGSVIIAASTSSTVAAGTGFVYVTPYTVAGSVLTVGTLAQFTTGAANGSSIQRLVFLNTGRWYMSFAINANTVNYNAIVSLAGTVATISAVVRTTATMLLVDTMVISSTKILVVVDTSGTNAVIVTDSAGTCSVSSAVSVGISTSGTVRSCVNLIGTTAYVLSTNTTYNVMFAVDCSTATPVVTRVTLSISVVANTTNAYTIGTDAYGRVAPSRVMNANFSQAITVEGSTKTNLMGALRGVPFVVPTPTITGEDSQTTTTCWYGMNQSQVWQSNTLSTGVLTKVECVA